MSADCYEPIHIHVHTHRPDGARMETVVTVLMGHDEALRLAMNESRAVLPGHATSGTLSLRRTAAILAAMPQVTP